MNDFELFKKQKAIEIEGIFFEPITKGFPAKKKIQVIKLEDLDVFWKQQEKQRLQEEENYIEDIEYSQDLIKDLEEKIKKQIQRLDFQNNKMKKSNKYQLGRISGNKLQIEFLEDLLELLKK